MNRLGLAVVAVGVIMMGLSGVIPLSIASTNYPSTITLMLSTGQTGVMLSAVPSSSIPGIVPSLCGMVTNFGVLYNTGVVAQNFLAYGFGNPSTGPITVTGISGGLAFGLFWTSLSQNLYIELTSYVYPPFQAPSCATTTTSSISISTASTSSSAITTTSSSVSISTSTMSVSSFPQPNYPVFFVGLGLVGAGAFVTFRRKH